MLNDGFGARGGGIRTLTSLATGPALSEKVPALIERHLDRAKLAAFGIGQSSADMRLLKRALLICEQAQPVLDCLVIHLALLGGFLVVAGIAASHLYPQRSRRVTGTFVA